MATIEARALLAETMIRTAREAYNGASATSSQIVPLPQAVRAKNLSQPASNEKGWLAVAIERDSSGELKYLLVKGSSEAAVPASKLEFD